MLTTSRLLLISGSLVCAALFARCSNTPTMSTVADLATTPDDMTAAADMTVVPGAPTLTAVSPAFAVNTGGGTLTLTGTNFQAGATVTVGGTAATNVMVVSPTQITLTIPAKTATCGAAPIVITNPDTKSVTSPNLFSYRTAMLGFAAQTALTMGTNTRHVIVADLDKKNGPDIISANSGNGTLSVRLNTGNGTFAAATAVTLGGMSPYSVAAGLVNGDTNLDLVAVMNSGPYIKPRLGVGDGTFTTPQGDPSYTTGASPFDVVLGDLDNNGKLDALAVNSVGNTVSIFIGNGDGTFGTATTSAVGMGAVAAILADFNKDGKLDFATADKGANQVTAKLGVGNGTFGVGTVVTGVNAPSDLAAGDFNGDGFPDLAIVNSGAGTVRVTLGVGDGTFNSAQGTTSAVGTVAATTRSLVLGDFNLDGFLDIAVANQSERTVSVLLGDGTGKNFATKVDFSIGNANTGNAALAIQLATGDLNGDGLPDLVSTDYAADSVSVLLSQCR